MGSVGGDEPEVEPRQRPLLLRGVGERHGLAHLLAAHHGLRVIPGPAHRDADLFVRQVDQHLRRTEVADIGPHALQQALDVREVAGIDAVRVVAEVEHRHRYDVGRLVEEADAAVGKALHDLRLEDHVAARDRRIGHALADHALVVGEAGRAPEVGHAVAVAGIVLGDRRHDPRVEVLEVRQLRLVERLVDADRDQARRVAFRVHHDVVAGAPGEQARLGHLGGVVGVVVDLDAVLALEIPDRVRRDVVRPGEDVEDFLLGRRRRARCERARGVRAAPAGASRVTGPRGRASGARGR